MKKRTLALLMTTAIAAAALTGCGSANQTAGDIVSAAETSGQMRAEPTGNEEDSKENGAAGTGQNTSGAVYKVGIVQFVDDASLNQIEAAIEKELDAKAAELGVTFDYGDYTYNGQADSTVLNQIACELIASEVDVIVPIATPAAMIMQNATEENQIPVVFSAVSDPAGAGLVADMNAPGANITGTSDALNTEAVMDLIFAADYGTLVHKCARPCASPQNQSPLSRFYRYIPHSPAFSAQNKPHFPAWPPQIPAEIPSYST
mgnify:CR=1 FL=1